MILPRDLNSSAPRARTKLEDHATLLVSWWCTGFALAIILVRLAGRYVRTEKLFREDKIMAWSIIPLLARMALVHMVLIWGTNNAITTGLTAVQIEHREIGSRLVLASRIMYAAFLWIAKFSISEFLKRLTSQVWKRSYEIGLQCIRWFLILTFVAVVIATLTECRPFYKYWQLIPDPGARCRLGYAQLITMGASDVTTDLLLVGFPIPIVMKSALATKRKSSLILLFALSLILVGITIYRVVGVIDRHSTQQFRSLLASLEILAAAAVSNALVLGSFVRDRGAKKQRFRFGSVGGNSSLDPSPGQRRGTLTARNWGSDADLVGDLGMRLEPELSAIEVKGPRPAPIALPLASQAKNVTPNAMNRDWAFQSRTSGETDEMDIRDCTQETEKGPNSSSGSVISPRRMSFFDVGGLLENDRTPPLPRYPIPAPSSRTSSSKLASHPETEEFTIHRNLQGRNALLQDIGGLLASGPPDLVEPAPTMRNFSRPCPSPSSKQDTDFSPADSSRRDSSPSLRDVGGLLS